MDIKNKEIFCSRDVIFHESIFSFHSIPHSKTFIDSFQTTVILKSTSIDCMDYLDNHIPPSIHNETVPINDQDGSSIVPSTSSHIAPTRTSSRKFKQPSYLRDYHCHMQKYNFAPSTTILYLLNAYLSYDSIHPIEILLSIFFL